jgi:hypothetical protein
MIFTVSKMEEARAATLGTLPVKVQEPSSFGCTTIPATLTEMLEASKPPAFDKFTLPDKLIPEATVATVSFLSGAVIVSELSQAAKKASKNKSKNLIFHSPFLFV